MSNFCFRCGHNQEADRAVVIDGFRIELGQGMAYGATEIKLTPMELSFAHTLASYPGRYIEGYVLLTRAGSESADAESSVARSSLSKIRRSLVAKIEAAGAPNLIEQRARYGVRWLSRRQALSEVA